METNKTQGKPPIKSIRAGGVKATIWENTNSDNQVFNTIVVDRTYKDKKGEWQVTNSFRITDLPKIALVSQKAFEFFCIKEDKAEYKEIEENI